MPMQGLSNKNTLGYLGEREKESLKKEGMALTSLAYLQKKKNVYAIFTEEPFPLKHGIKNRRADLVKVCLVIKKQIHTPNLKSQRMLKCRTTGLPRFYIAFEDKVVNIGASVFDDFFSLTHL